MSSAREIDGRTRLKYIADRRMDGFIPIPRMWWSRFETCGEVPGIGDLVKLGRWGATTLRGGRVTLLLNRQTAPEAPSSTTATNHWRSMAKKAARCIVVAFVAVSSKTNCPNRLGDSPPLSSARAIH